MAERPFTYFILAGIAISLTVSGGERLRRTVHRNVIEMDCFILRVSVGWRCEPICENSTNICLKKCLCEGKLECDIFAQECICRNEGWKGRDCSVPCDSGFYGKNCAFKCNCKNNGTCDRFSGKCTCMAGYQGSLCEEKCPIGTHGYQCSNECKCQNDAVCHHVDGSCDCTAGWMGSVCAEPCPEGTYGINCSETCDCFKNAPCNATTGKCIYTHDMFDRHCDVNSTSEANNLNGSEENSFISNRNNSCLPGFSGTNCENRACPDNKWGQTCSNECKCRNGSYCHPETGVCWCELGWTGEDCSVRVKEAHFEEQIMEKEYPSSHSSLIVPAICVPIVSILIIIVASIVYYKKRSVRNEDNLALPSYSHLDEKEDL